MTDEAPQRSFEFGDFRLDTRRRLLSDSNGHPVNVTAKAFDALVSFLEQPGVVIERSTLIDRLWPETFVEENNLSQTVAMLRRALGDGYIATVRGRGYQFIAEVKVLPSSTALTPFLSRNGSRALLYAAAGSLLGALALGVAIWSTASSPPPLSGDLPRLAVLPCENLSPNPQDAYLALSLHQELLDQLGKLTGLRVTSRSSVLPYSDRRPTPSQVGTDLEVDAVMECSVRQAGGHLVVTAQLSDPESDSQLWSQSFPDAMNDMNALVAMQSELIQRVSETLGVGYREGEQQRIEQLPTRSVDAYVHYLKAQQRRLDQGGSRDAAFLAYIDRALRADPGFAAAHVERGFTHLFRAVRALQALEPTGEAATQRGTAITESRLAVDAAQKALSLDPDLGPAYAVLAAVDILHGRVTTGFDKFERATMLEPNDAENLGLYAGALLRHRRVEKAHEILDRIRQIDPLSHEVAYYFYLTGDCSTAIKMLQNVVDARPTDILAHLHIGWCAALEDDAGVAEPALRIAEELLTSSTAEGASGPGRVSLLVYAYGRIGLEDDAHRLFERFRSGLAAEASPLHWMDAYLGIGDTDAAFESASISARSPLPLFTGESHKLELILNSYLDKRLETPRFVELRERLAADDSLVLQ